MYNFEHLFMISFCHLYIFFVEISVQVFFPFLNRVVSFKSSLCILDNSPFSDLPFGNIFSHSVDCNLLTVLCRAEDFNFNEVLTHQLFLSWIIIPLVYF